MYLDGHNKIWFYSIYFGCHDVFYEREHTCVINYKRNMEAEQSGDNWCVTSGQIFNWVLKGQYQKNNIFSLII